MQLADIGAPYTPAAPTVATIETDIQLCFRDFAFKMRTLKEYLPKSSIGSLTYRNVRYNA
ncbi:hypothetical protein U2F10_25550 [Leptothoe sp. EHU-05/26/07-4]